MCTSNTKKKKKKKKIKGELKKKKKKRKEISCWPSHFCFVEIRSIDDDDGAKLKYG